MPYIEWTQELSVGVEDMDAEHQQWISILNELFDAMNSGDDHQIIGSIIDKMTSYSKSHLAHEEIFLAKIEYPDLEMHKRKHDTLIKKLDNIKEQFETSVNFKLTVNAIQLLKEWLTNHILVTDKKYGRHAKSLVR
jgi:hemerythrin